MLSDYGDGEFAGPAAYALAEMAFTEKDYAAALPLFHRSAAKSKESAVAVSARYFEARCLEVLGRKEEACDIYLEVAGLEIEFYREDARWTAASILMGREKNRCAQAIRSAFERNAEASFKAESAVRGA